MRLATLLPIMRSLAPEALAESWDKVGLQMGDLQQNITRALLCIDFTPAVLDQAIQQKVQLIIAYHPPMFAPLSRLTEDDWKQRLLIQALRHHLAIYSPHTALDAAPGGMNDWWCDALGRGVRQAITPHAGATNPSGGGVNKIVTFVPAKAVDRVRTAMAEAGAGCIGAYSECSFTSQGIGTFRGSANTNPTIGKPGRFETTPEVRLEMVCPDEVLPAVQRALLQAHPYEEPAFDVYPLLPPLRREVSPVHPQTTAVVGAGRLVTLDEPVTLSALVKKVRTRLGDDCLQIITPPQVKWSDKNRKVHRIGVCVGAGGSLLAPALKACQNQLDVFITGEMRHHDQLDATQRGVTLLLAGHTQTERPYLSTYRDRLAQRTGKQINWFISHSD